MGDVRNDYRDSIDHTLHDHTKEGWCTLKRVVAVQETPLSWQWLESTRRLQREVYGFDWGDATHETVATSVKDNVLAAIVELTELLREVSWKYWAHDESFVNRAEVLKEAVDVAHFVGNIMVAIGVTDDEWEEAYQAKQAENRRRQREGYTVRK